jgi:hypothetical protein
MKTTTKKMLKSKKGTVIYSGETVEIRFDVKLKDGTIADSIFSINTEDGRKINIRNPKGVLKMRVPSLKTLERWSFDGIAESVFGERVEPDGHDQYGSPSWLLFFGYI